MKADRFLVPALAALTLGASPPPAPADVVIRNVTGIDVAGKAIPGQAVVLRGNIIVAVGAGFLNSYDYPGIGLHDELALYVRYGLTPAQVLASTTRTGPAWLGKSARYGAIAPGKAADLVLLDRNPLTDIASTRAIRGAVIKGKFDDRAALDAMLAGVRRTVAAFPEPKDS